VGFFFFLVGFSFFFFGVGFWFFGVFFFFVLWWRCPFFARLVVFFLRSERVPFGGERLVLTQIPGHFPTSRFFRPFFWEHAFFLSAIGCPFPLNEDLETI